MGRVFDVAVIGAGVAGLAGALAASRTARTVLVTEKLPSADEVRRIDAIPARTLALLSEFGVRPHAIGVDGLHSERVVSWEHATPSRQLAPPTAHVERPRLELALFEALLRRRDVDIVLSRVTPRWDGVFAGDGWRAVRLIDATGRAAVSAETVVRATPSWGSRFFLTDRATIPASPALRIAALQDGYAYRLGSADLMGIGLVGRSVLVKGPPADVEAAVRDASAGWLLDGMPSLAAMRAGDSGIGSLQWSLGGNGVRIGDANLARDALSSQGIAVACSEALYAAAIRTPVDAALVHARQIEQRATHLDTLGRVIERCRFREASIWSDYASFVARFGDRPVPAETAALRQNQVQRMTVRTVT